MAGPNQPAFAQLPDRRRAVHADGGGRWLAGAALNEQDLALARIPAQQGHVLARGLPGQIDVLDRGDLHFRPVVPAERARYSPAGHALRRTVVDEHARLRQGSGDAKQLGDVSPVVIGRGQCRAALQPQMVVVPGQPGQKEDGDGPDGRASGGGRGGDRQTGQRQIEIGREQPPGKQDERRQKQQQTNNAEQDPPVPHQQRKPQHRQPGEGDQEDSPGIEGDGLGLRPEGDLQPVGIVASRPEQHRLNAERQRHSEERRQTQPAAAAGLLAQPQLVSGQRQGQHHGQLLRLVGQPEGDKTHHPAAVRPRDDRRQREGGAQQVEHVHRFPQRVEDAHVKGKEDCAGACRFQRQLQAAQQVENQQDVEEVQGVNNGDVRRKPQARPARHHREVSMAHGTEIHGGVNRRGQPREIGLQRNRAGPTDVVQLIVLEISLIGAPVRYQKQQDYRAECGEKEETALPGHGNLWREVYRSSDSVRRTGGGPR